jgi:uncharacterized small protein (DUF1192 family)
MGFAIEEDRPRRIGGYEIGQDLSVFSIEEIDERISLLREEISRLERNRDQKTAQRAAADSIFASR